VFLNLRQSKNLLQAIDAFHRVIAQVLYRRIDVVRDSSS